MARHGLKWVVEIKKEAMTQPTRKKTAQLSVRLDEELFQEYKDFLSKQDLKMTEDIESYIKARLSKTDNVVDINAFNELTKKVLSIEEQMGKLRAS